MRGLHGLILPYHHPRTFCCGSSSGVPCGTKLGHRSWQHYKKIHPFLLWRYTLRSACSFCGDDCASYFLSPVWLQGNTNKNKNHALRMQCFGASATEISSDDFSGDIPPHSPLLPGVLWLLVVWLPAVVLGPLIVLPSNPRMMALSFVPQPSSHQFESSASPGETQAIYRAPRLGAQPSSAALAALAGRRHVWPPEWQLSL